MRSYPHQQKQSWEGMLRENKIVTGDSIRFYSHGRRRSEGGFLGDREKAVTSIGEEFFFNPGKKETADSIQDRFA